MYKASAGKQSGVGRLRFKTISSNALEGSGQTASRMEERSIGFREMQKTNDLSLMGRLDSFVENAPGAAAMFDRDMRYLAASPAWLRDYKVEGPIVGLSHYEVFPEIPQRWKDIHARALAGETSSEECDAFERADGARLWLRWQVIPWRLPDGEVGGIVIFTRDITETKVAQTELAEREAHLRSILATVPEAMIVVDEQGRVTSFSATASTLFGYSPDEVVGRSVSMLMPKPDRDEHDASVARYLRTGEARIIGYSRVVKAVAKDGTVFPVELSVGEAQAAGRRIFTGFARDMTSRQRIEEALRQSQKMDAVGQLTGGDRSRPQQHIDVDHIQSGVPRGGPDRPRPARARERGPGRGAGRRQARRAAPRLWPPPAAQSGAGRRRPPGRERRRLAASDARRGDRAPHRDGPVGAMRRGRTPRNCKTRSSTLRSMRGTPCRPGAG